MQHIKEIRSIKSIKYKVSSSSRSGANTTKTEIRDRSGWRWRRSRRRLRRRTWRERRGRPRRAPGLPVVERMQLAQAVLRTSTLLDSLLELCQLRQRRIYPLFGRLPRTTDCQHTSAHTLKRSNGTAVGFLFRHWEHRRWGAVGTPSRASSSPALRGSMARRRRS